MSENKIDELIYEINRLTLDNNIRKLKNHDKEMILGTIWIYNHLVDLVGQLHQKELL